MSEIELLSALLGPGANPDLVRFILARARELDVDVLRVASQVTGVPEATLYARAADLADMAYCADVSPYIGPFAPLARIDALASLKSVRGMVAGREVLFVAPPFSALAALFGRVEASPGLRDALCIVPPDALRHAIAAANDTHLYDSAIRRLSRLYPFASAHLDLTRAVRIAFVCALAALVALAVATPAVMQPLFTPLLTAILALPSAFRLWAAFTMPKPAIPPPLLADRDLPVYSVLVPLRNEARMVPQLVWALRRLDYPAEKLDIKFVVESVSHETLMALRPFLDDARFELVVVPPSRPATKPKAINYALPLVRGRHVVVYDAEDVPHPGQLRLAASLFARHPEIDCMQAELVIENARTNWLTTMFSAEYAGHFGVLLPAIARAGLPMPLGGTSNHFRTDALLAAGGWDAYNVTEDADLGIRLARIGMATMTFASPTLEEAPERLADWMRQRTRWIKGWMLTLIVHNRRPLKLWRELGWRDFLVFQIFVGGLAVATPLHGVFLLAVAGRMGYNLIAHGLVDLWTMVHLAVLILGYGGAIAVAVLGLQRLNREYVASTLMAMPLYWALASLAAVRAAYELIVAPYYWAKTEHGLLSEPRPDAEQHKADPVLAAPRLQGATLKV